MSPILGPRRPPPGPYAGQSVRLADLPSDPRTCLDVAPAHGWKQELGWLSTPLSTTS
jgi:hypothetical protein